MTTTQLLRIIALAVLPLGAVGQVTVAIQPLSVPAAAADEEALRPLVGRLQDRLAQAVVKLPNVHLLDRQYVAELLKEQNFAPASVDRGAADNIGRMLRADVMLLLLFYPLQNTGVFSKLAGGKHWTASADAVEVATGRVVAKPVCGGIESEPEVLTCAQQIAREFQPAVAPLWNQKQQQIRAREAVQQQQARTQAEADQAAAAARQREEDQQRFAAQQKSQAMRLEELRKAETLQRERTEEERLSLQHMREAKAQQEARAKLDAALEQVRARYSDLAGEANAMLDYWNRMERELRQRGAALRSEIRSPVARLRSDMAGAEDCLKRSQLNEAVAYLAKARTEIETLEQMK